MNTEVNGENGGKTPKQRLAELANAICRAEDWRPLVEECRLFLEANPELAWAELNTTTNARRGAVGCLGPLGELSGPYYLEQARALEKELAGPDPTATVRALAEQGATDYVWLVTLQSRALTGLKGVFPEAIDRAHRRYLRTLRMLATVRRMERSMDIHITHEVRNSTKTVTATAVPAARTPPDTAGGLLGAAEAGGRPGK